MKPRIMKMKSKLVIWGNEGIDHIFEVVSKEMKRNHEDSWIAQMQNENRIKQNLEKEGLRFDLKNPRQELTHESFFESA